MASIAFWRGSFIFLCLFNTKTEKPLPGYGEVSTGEHAPTFIWPLSSWTVLSAFLWKSLEQDLKGVASCQLTGNVLENSWHHDFSTERVSSKLLFLILSFQLYNIFEVCLRFLHFVKTLLSQSSFLVFNLFIQHSQRIVSDSIEATKLKNNTYQGI